MRAKFVSLVWVPSKPGKPEQHPVYIGGVKRKFERAKLILALEGEDGKTYSIDIYTHVKYVKDHIRITKHVREQLEYSFKNYSFEVFREEIIGIYAAIRKAVLY